MIFQLSDTKYKILNVQSSIGFNGWENMNIRCKILILMCTNNQLILSTSRSICPGMIRARKCGK